jgi:DNA polymerase-3 subunit delta
MLELLREEKLDMIEKSNHADINDFDFAQTDNRFELENKIRSALRGSSLFSTDKLTVVRNFWSTQRKSKKGVEDKREESEDEKLKKNDFEDFVLDAVSRINSTDKLFFLESRDIDKRSRAYKFFEELSKNKKIQKKEFPMPLGFKFNVWLEERIENRGGKISKTNLDLLAMLLGRGMEQKEKSGQLVTAYDLHQAGSEIDKLISYCDGREIEKGDITLLVSASSDMNIFSLIESIGKKDKNRALAILSGQIREGFNENYILTMLVYHFRNLISIKSLLNDGLGAGEISKMTKIHPMVVEKNIAYCRNLKEENLVMIYEKLYSADLSIKTGKMEPELALDILIAVI